MSGTLRNDFECLNPDTVLANRRKPSMKFWGLLCVGGKQYASVVKQRFRVTMAVLDPRSDNVAVTNKVVMVFVYRDEEEYLLCVLKHGKIQQCNLNVIFEKGETIKFHADGYGVVFLSGYHVSDFDDDACFNRSVVSSIVKSLKPPEKDKSPIPIKSKTTNGVETEDSLADEQSENDEEESNIDEDEDYSDIDDVNEEKNESTIIKNAEEEDSDLEEIFPIDDEICNEEAKKSPQTSSESKKRKNSKTPESKKRRKSDTVSTPKSMNDTDENCVENLSSDDASSAECTPIPTKKANIGTVSTEKKKRKKKSANKMLDNLNDSEMKSQTPRNKSNKRKNKNANERIQGTEVVIKDNKVGVGSVASKGKLVSIQYVGRLFDQKIFDSSKKPYTFKLGDDQVLPGLDIGITGMKVGGRRIISIPPNMWRQGSVKFPNVASDSTLYFTVDLVHVK